MDRKEAIEVIRSNWPEGRVMLKGALQVLIPEFRESEDEKNWKAVLECVKDDALRAWLEKQKERKPFAHENDFVSKPKGYIENAAHNYAMNFGDKESELYIEIFDAYKAGAYYAELRQKPAEWSEDIIQKAVKEVGLTQHQIAWFKTNVFPSKQEWSEEDEKKIVFLERLIRYNFPEGQYGWVDGNKGGFVTKLEAISMLKSLRPQPQWKPTERMVNALKWVVSEFHPDCPETMEQLEYLYTELKSMYYGPIK